MSQILNEAGLSRLLTHFATRPVAMITASRSHVQAVDIATGKLSYTNIPVNSNSTEKDFGLSEDQIKQWNNTKNKILRRSLSQEGLSFIPVDGGYPEVKDGVPVDSEAYEDSLFVIGQPIKSGNFAHFTKIIAGYGKSFNQDSVFLKDANEAPFLLGTNGAEWPGEGEKIPLDKDPSLFHKNIDDINGPHTDKSHGAYFTALSGKQHHAKRFSFKTESVVPEKLNIGELIYSCGGQVPSIQGRSYFVIESYIKDNKYPYGSVLSNVTTLQRLSDSL